MYTAITKEIIIDIIVFEISKINVIINLLKFHVENFIIKIYFSKNSLI